MTNVIKQDPQPYLVGAGWRYVCPLDRDECVAIAPGVISCIRKHVWVKDGDSWQLQEASQ